MLTPARCSFTAIAILASACTHWATVEQPGPPQEVGRNLVGSPQIEEVTSSSASAGFAMNTGSRNYGRASRGYAVGGLEGSSGTIKRTHCVQQAQIDYVQDISYESKMEGRGLDVAGGLIVGVLGLAVIAGANASYNSDLEWHNMDPSFFSKPEQPTGAYAMGGIMAVGGAGWLIYSLTSLPKGPAPVRPPVQRRWTETHYVEAQGCGLVPADRVPPSAAPGM